jgi:hypothetical protein
MYPPARGTSKSAEPVLSPVLFPADVAVRPVMIRSGADLGRAFAVSGRFREREHVYFLSFRVTAQAHGPPFSTTWDTRSKRT